MDLFLAEVTPEVAQSVTELPVWAGILLSVITVVVTAIAGFLKKKFDVDNKKTAIDTSKSLMEQKNFIIDNRLIPFAISTGEHWLITQLPALVKDATDGDGFEWKTHWKNLLKYMKTEVVKKFADENVDIIKLFGEDYLDKLMNRLAMKLVKKLPESVGGFIPKAIVDMITRKVAEFTVEKAEELLDVKIRD